MTDITLTAISSGYNLSKINTNFTEIESKINEEILHLIGGNNIMAQAIDMNSNRILNLPKPSSGGEPIINSQLVELANAEFGAATNVIYTDPESVIHQLDDFLDTTEDRLKEVEDTGVESTYFATVGLSQIGTLNLSAYSYAVFYYRDSGGDKIKADLKKNNSAAWTTANNGTRWIDSAGNKWEVIGDASADLFGARRGNNSFDSQPAIQGYFDWCESEGIGATGDGTYYVGSTVTLRCSFSTDSRMIIQPLSTFASGVPVDYNDTRRWVLIIDQSNLSIRNLRTANNGVADLVGFVYNKQQIKSWKSGAAGFKVNVVVKNFSVSIYEGVAVGGGSSGKGLVAYAPDFNNEINALLISGGEYYQNLAGAIDIGDRDGLFTTILGVNDYMGNGIRVINNPTLDQGFLSVDQVIDCQVDAYFEQGGATHEAAVRLGGKAADSVRGFKIQGYARDYKYYVKCLGGVSGIDMQNCFSRAIEVSALYLVSDQFSYTYKNNTSINSFTHGKEVHTGIRFGRSGTNFFARATIATSTVTLVAGAQHKVGNEIFPEARKFFGRDQFFYLNTDGRKYVTVSSAAGSQSGSTFTFDTLADSYNFNGGDIVTIGGNATYIVAVDYVAGTATLDNGFVTGATTLAQTTVKPFLDGRSFSKPTRTDVVDGSVVWNIFTSVSTPQYWVLKSGVWTDGTP